MNLLSIIFRSNKFYFLFILLYFISVVLSNISLFPSSTQLFSAILLIITVFKFLYFSRFFKFSFYKFKFIRYFVFFLILYVLYFLLHFAGVNYYIDISSNSSVRVLFTALLWILTFFIFFYFGLFNLIDYKFIKKYSVFFYVLASLIILSSILSQYDSDDLLNTASGYTVVMIMPLLLYFYPKNSFLIIVLSFFITLISGKRGALVIEIILLLFYIIKNKSFDFKTFSLKNKSFLIIFFILCVVASFAFIYALDSVLVRFDDIFFGTSREGDARYGSGRNVFWLITFDTWLNSNFFNILFGLGFYSTSSTLGLLYGLNIQAHNDFLEILHCFGLFGFFIYLSFIISWIFFINKLKVSNFHMFLLIICLIIFIGRSFIAGVLYRPDTIFLSISFGFILGDLIRKKYLYYEN